MCSIAWGEFTWDAFATLTAGIMAVGAAWWVGQRQIAISASQTDILDRQTRLTELSLRHDLFERRHEVYTDVRDYLLHIIQYATYPDRDLELRFLQSLSIAQFLFNNTVHDRLQEIWMKANHYGFLKKEMSRIFEREGHYGAGNPDKEFEEMTWINQTFTGLPNLFGDDMRLA